MSPKACMSFGGVSARRMRSVSGQKLGIKRRAQERRLRSSIVCYERGDDCIRTVMLYKMGERFRVTERFQVQLL